MSVTVENTGFGHYELVITQCNRSDFIQLANILRASTSCFLQQIGMEIESELMEISDDLV